MFFFVLFNLIKCARRRIFYLDNAIISQIYKFCQKIGSNDVKY